MTSPSFDDVLAQLMENAQALEDQRRRKDLVEIIGFVRVGNADSSTETILALIRTGRIGRNGPPAEANWAQATQRILDIAVELSPAPLRQFGGLPRLSGGRLNVSPRPQSNDPVRQALDRHKDNYVGAMVSAGMLDRDDLRDDEYLGGLAERIWAGRRDIATEVLPAAVTSLVERQERRARIAAARAAAPEPRRGAEFRDRGDRANVATAATEPPTPDGGTNVTTFVTTSGNSRVVTHIHGQVTAGGPGTADHLTSPSSATPRPGPEQSGGEEDAHAAEDPEVTGLEDGTTAKIFHAPGAVFGVAYGNVPEGTEVHGYLNGKRHSGPVRKTR